LDLKWYGEKKIKIVEINSASDASNCHIAFISKSNKKKASDLIHAVNSHNTLVVTEDDMVDEGAAISFVFVQSKMNFKISKDKIEESGLKVSNSLISIGIPA
jgi:glutathionylspermidine synthase